MEIDIRIYETIAEITVSNENTTIKDDLAYYDRNKKKQIVDESFIESLITASNDLSRFNNKSDVDFVYEIFSAFLNSSEQKEFIDKITE